MKLKFLDNIFLVFLIVYYERNVSAGLISISKRITSSILSNCTSGAGNIRLFHTSPYVSLIETKPGEENSGQLNYFNSSLKTVFLIHGFLSDGTKDWVNDTRSALLEKEARNIFVVDWRVGACSETIKYFNFQSYRSAVSNTKQIGDNVARYIQNIVNVYGILTKDIWIIGHSLGAHVAGFAGKILIARRLGKLGRITGLDPAGPFFRGVNSTERLDKIDAIFVEIIHTSSLLGLQEAIGDVDFYFNGGGFQMSCLLKKPGCSHDRAVDYYLEVIRNPNCHFIGQAWSRTEGFKNTLTNCSNFCTTIVGQVDLNFPPRGSFYVETNAHREPYCTGNPPSSIDSTTMKIPVDRNPLDENIFDIL